MCCLAGRLLYEVARIMELLNNDPSEIERLDEEWLF